MPSHVGLFPTKVEVPGSYYALETFENHKQDSEDLIQMALQVKEEIEQAK